MRSHEEQRQQKISQESLRQREAVKPSGYAGAPSSSSAQLATSSRKDQNDLVERMLQGDNLRLAFMRVVQNGGAPGMDGVTVAHLQAYLKTHWDSAKAQLLAGTYRPTPVKRVEIPKPGGGVWLLGIPTVMDRFLQQALLQVMNPIFDTLKLIRAYLNAGFMAEGSLEKTKEGTPQGGPLSPLLENILLDDLDKELTKRGLRFVRYADDCAPRMRSA